MNVMSVRSFRSWTSCGACARPLPRSGKPVRDDAPGLGSPWWTVPLYALDSGYRGVQRPGPVLHTLATFTSTRAAADDEGPDLALWASDPEGDPAEGWLDVMLWRPQARGRVLIASTDPSRPPRIWLPAPTDEDVLVLCQGVRLGLDVLASTPLQAVCAPSPAPVPTEPEPLGVWTRANSYSLPHTVGTCAMGASPERGAVVNGAGQVHGIDRLYVADASILPGPPTGFPHLVTLMTASRIADGILSEPD